MREQGNFQDKTRKGEIKMVYDVKDKRAERNLAAGSGRAIHRQSGKGPRSGCRLRVLNGGLG